MSLNTYTVGLTGGIGSGKTTVADMFAELGVLVVDADLSSRRVVEVGSEALQKIQHHFGPSVIQANGALDRRALREIIFADDEQRLWLEQLLHPLIFADLTAQLNDCDTPYALLVSPLLFEAGHNKMCQRVLVVDAEVQQQITRVVTRDNEQAERVQAIIDTQLSRQQRLSRTDDTIDNSVSKTQLKQQITQLHKRYLNYAQNSD